MQEKINRTDKSQLKEVVRVSELKIYKLTNSISEREEEQSLNKMVVFNNENDSNE